MTDHKDGDKKETISYEYDKAGNRTKKGKGSTQTTYTYNGLDQLLTAVTVRDGEQVKESDSKGQVTTVNEYDAENRLSRAVITMPEPETLPGDVTEPESGTATGQASEPTSGQEPEAGTDVTESGNRVKTITQENLYNGDGQRIRESEGAKETHYFYQDGVVSYTMEGKKETKAVQNLLGLEGNVILAERAVEISGETVSEGAASGGMASEGAAEDGTASGGTENSGFGYYLYNKDVQGSTTSILNESGTGEISYEYDDFGETEVNGNSVFRNEICYTGGIYDDVTGLYYLNARYYDPENGRFLTEDTYRGELKEPDTLHLYAYCKNNPINYVDPSGHLFIVRKVANLLFAGAMAYLAKWVAQIPSPKEHYGRNKYNTDLPRTQSEAKKQKYKKYSAAYSACHQFSAPKGKPNQKYVSKDGRKEVVYRYKKDVIVTDPRDIGTYNFGPGKGMAHIFKDLIPYLWWGNSKKDTTTRGQRCTKSALGMLNGKTKEMYQKVTKVLTKKKYLK